MAEEEPVDAFISPRLTVSRDDRGSATLHQMVDLGLESSPPALKGPESLVSEQLAHVHRAWSGLTGGRFAPSRKELDPSKFKHALRNIFVASVIDEGKDFRFALGGDTLIRFLHERMTTGQLLSELSGSLFHERALRVMRHCVSTRRPVAVGPTRSVLGGREFLLVEVLVLPLSDDGVAVTDLIGTIDVAPLAVENADVLAGSLPKAFPVANSE